MTRRVARTAYPPAPTDPNFRAWIYQFWTQMTRTGQLQVDQLSTAGITANQVLASNTANTAVVGKDLTGTTPIEVANSNTAITLSHANSGVTTGVYGNAAVIPQVNVSVTGHVQAVSNVTVNLPVAQLVPGTGNQVVRMTNNGSAAAWVDLVAGTNITLTQNAANIAVSSGDSTFQLGSHNAGSLPSASPAGQLIYVPDESGGAVPAFSDGSDWRRVTDRAVVT